ncbi:MAG: hypothetical protein JSW66_16865 [Phycisphaerales bacterium]|nr:MAG: hypothetical protein JSW66_16865 [Phycisphaerales bacterium]
MVIVTSIAFWALLIPAAVTSCFLARRHKQLRDYTFWVEQSLLQHRPETYIPQWRKRQRDKDICKKDHQGRTHVQTVVAAGDR